MIRIVAYDISDPRRLRRVAKTCQDYGARIEKSVFECDLDEPHFEALWQSLNELIDPDEDALIAYQVCRSCVRETRSAGLIARPSPVLVYLPWIFGGRRKPSKTALCLRNRINHWQSVT